MYARAGTEVVHCQLDEKVQITNNISIEKAAVLKLHNIHNNISGKLTGDSYIIFRLDYGTLFIQLYVMIELVSVLHIEWIPFKICFIYVFMNGSQPKMWNPRQ